MCVCVCVCVSGLTHVDHLRSAGAGAAVTQESASMEEEVWEGAWHLRNTHILRTLVTKHHPFMFVCRRICSLCWLASDLCVYVRVYVSCVSQINGAGQGCVDQLFSMPAVWIVGDSPLGAIILISPKQQPTTRKNVPKRPV